jgi:glycosyltransferase involved in cell wall biosynthesis
MRVLAATFAYNEGDKIRRTLARHPPARSYDLLVADDGSTDAALDGIDPGILVLRHGTNRGIGATMKEVFQYALDREYDVLVIHAGNDKDEPREIPLLLDPIISGAADFVQGSRYLGGGGFGNMPRYRVFSTRVLHPLVFSMAARKRVTESVPAAEGDPVGISALRGAGHEDLSAARVRIHEDATDCRLVEHSAPRRLSGPGIEKMIATMHVPFVDLKSQRRSCRCRCIRS